jgi:hypothetical protein
MMYDPLDESREESVLPSFTNQRSPVPGVDAGVCLGPDRFGRGRTDGALDPKDQRIYLKVRGKTAEFREFQSRYRGEVEVDESYFGPRQVRGKRGRGAGGKTIVFGIFERNGHVDTGIVPDAEKNTLVKAIRGQVDSQSVIHSDGGGGTTGWLTSVSPSTSESTIPSATSPTAAATSTASSRCGATPNDG